MITPIIAHPRCALLHGEAMYTLRHAVRDKSFSLICTDPPYGEHTHKNLGKEKRGDGYESREALEFPPLTKEQVYALAIEFVRISTGWIIVFTDDRSVEWWGSAIESAGGRWVRTGHWVKTSPMPQMSSDRPAVGTEPIVIAHSFPPGEGRMVWNGKGRAAVWRGPRDMDGLHPNQKPLWLMQELVGLFCPAGGSVLDPFTGSASTGVSALATARIPGLAPLEPACKGCSKKHADLNLAPLPERVSFLGIEGSLKTLATAKARLTTALQGVHV